MESPQHGRDMDLLELIQRRATKMIPGMEQQNEDWLRAGAVQVEEGRLWGELRAAFSI